MSVMVPATDGVYVNVLAADDADHESVDGVNVPPAPPSLNVMVSVVVRSGATVNAPEAMPGDPPDGPVSA